ncbi:glycosyltransferase [Robbsia andropogonis]|uniref:glycosyltransferase n=2 Tax=Robbsia andropogonis TaxID=28092 RepID=UPI00046662FD|nr:glycosyltransferase [Robbsia andropogonis]MCP1118617.1 glycosyltransferase [Robbsia andropogonis]MCP1128084.1 glycosyltransferase [Robbsia andropogonis]
MRIAMLTHIKHPIRQPFAGGLESFTYDMTLGLRRRGHDVTLFASSGSAPELHHVAILDDENYAASGIRGAREAFFKEYLDEHVAYMTCMQRLDNQNFDVVFNNSLHYVPLTMASLIATPMLTVLHTPPFFELVNAISGVHRKSRLRFATVSNANARSWGKWVPHCDVVANGIDLSVWRPGGSSTYEHAIWFGRLVPDKGAHLAIDAARLAGLSIEIVGQATDEAYFQAEIAPRLNDRARYIGHLARADLIERLQRASVCFVTPCWDEPFGLVVAESLACGTPVAAFARGAIPELLTADSGFTAPPGDVAGLAKAALAAMCLSRADCRLIAESRWRQAAMFESYERLLSATMQQSAVVDA